MIWDLVSRKDSYECYCCERPWVETLRVHVPGKPVWIVNACGFHAAFLRYIAS